MSRIARQQRLFGRTQHLVRDYFVYTDALEVFPPTLVANPGMEPDIRPLRVDAPHVLELHDYFLHTSPEFAIKAALAGVDSDVFAITRAYRDEVSSERHSAEFQILEWYRRDATYQRLMEDVEALFVHLLDGLSVDPVPPQWQPPFEQLSYRESFRRFAGIDCDDQRPGTWHDALRARGISTSESDDIGFLESVAYSELVEPALGSLGPCFIRDYPVRHAALAKRKDDCSMTAERVEFYLPFPGEEGSIRGLEIANGFSELLDAREQRARFEAAQSAIESAGMPPRPMPEDVLNGIERLGATAGMALGVDRLTVWLAWHLLEERWTVPELYFGRALQR